MLDNKFLETSRNVYYTSYLTIFSIIHSFYNAIYQLSFINIFVLITSINYWRFPIRGFRRNVDISTVLISLSYHLYYTYIYNYFQYLYLLLLCIISYVISIILIEKNFYKLGHAFHSILHILANINNFYLYKHIIIFK